MTGNLCPMLSAIDRSEPNKNLALESCRYHMTNKKVRSIRLESCRPCAKELHFMVESKSSDIMDHPEKDADDSFDVASKFVDRGQGDFSVSTARPGKQCLRKNNFGLQEKAGNLPEISIRRRSILFNRTIWISREFEDILFDDDSFMHAFEKLLMM